MKRTGFIRRYTPLRSKIALGRTKPLSARKASLEALKSKLKVLGLRKSSTSFLKKKLWLVFSEFIRLRDKGICFICGRKAEGSGYHAAHFIPKSVGGLILYFDEENVNGCCYHCNINLGGNLYEYGKKLGEELVTKLYALKNIITKWTAEDYVKKIEHYKQELEKMKKLSTPIT